jgi:hypothetical protein
MKYGNTFLDVMDTNCWYNSSSLLERSKACAADSRLLWFGKSGEPVGDDCKNSFSDVVIPKPSLEERLTFPRPG